MVADSDDDGPSSGEGTSGGNEPGSVDITGSAIDAGEATLLGLVDIALLDDVGPGQEPGVDTVYAGFRRFASTEDLDTVLSFIRPAAPDMCVLREDDGFTAFDRAPPVDAGEVLVFTSSAGTWAELSRIDGEEGIEYVEPENSEGSIVLPGSVPAGLVLDIPGADFPAFTAVPIPAVTPLDEIAPGRSSSSAAVTDTFTWDAADDPMSVVRFDFLVPIDDSGDNGLRSFACIAEDDGTFAIPPDTLAALGADASTNFLVTVTRETLQVERQGNALLLTSQSSEGR